MDSDDELLFRKPQIESSDDEDNTPLTVKRKACLTIDSDDECLSSADTETDDNTVKKIQTAKNVDDVAKHSINIDCEKSDSEFEADDSNDKKDNCDEDIAHKSGKSRIIFNDVNTLNDSDSDSDQEQASSILKKTSSNSDPDSDEEPLFLPKLKQTVADSGDEDNIAKSKPLTYDPEIYDQELSEDDTFGNAEKSEDDMDKSSCKKLSKKTSRGASEKARTAMMQEIYSEKQKMVRDTEISLPYHKPKQRTLKEFLERMRDTPIRKMSLKMSMKDVRFLKDIEDRSKDIDTFYKSESEDENDVHSDNNINAPSDSDEELANISPKVESPVKDSKSDSGVRTSLEIQHPTSTVAVVSPICEDTNIKDAGDLMETDAATNPVTVEADDVTDAATDETNAIVVETDDVTDKIISETDDTTDAVVVKADDDTGAVVAKTADEITNSLKNVDSDENFTLSLNETTNDYIAKGDNKPKTASFDYMMDTEDLDLHLDSEDIIDFPYGNQLRLSPDRPTNDVTDVVTDGSQSRLSPSISNTPKLSLLASKFPNMDINKIANTTPTIGVAKGGFIEFDDSPKKTPRDKSEVDALLERLARSTRVRQPDDNKKTEVVLDIVQKEQSADGQERLVSSSISVKVPGQQEVPINEVPGAQLTQLKSQLMARVLKQREVERQRRVKEKQFLDSEEVITDYQDGLPSEEQELTDQSDTDVETESEPEEDDVILKESRMSRHAYIDDEADEDDEIEEDSQDDCNDGDDDDDIGVVSKAQDDIESDSDEDEICSKPKEKKGCLIISSDDEGSRDKAEESDAEEFRLFYDESMDIGSMKTNGSNTAVAKEEQQISKKRLSNDLEDSLISMDSSLELIGSIVPPHQPYGGQSKKIRTETAVAVSPDENMSFFTQLINASPSEADDDNGCQYSLSQFGDAQLSHNVNETAKTSVSKSVEDSNDFDLLGLCSGRFSAPAPAIEPEKCKTSEGVDDLLGLCSGVFSTPAAVNRVPQGEELSFRCTSMELRSPEYDQPNVPFKGILAQDDDDMDCAISTPNMTADVTQKREVITARSSTDSRSPVNSITNLNENAPSADCPAAVDFSSDEEGILSRQKDRKSFKRKRRAYTLSEEEDEADQSEGEMRPKKKFTGFKDKLKGGIRSEFLDAEAELSGSDFDSADEYEPDLANDIMDEEEGDLEQYDEDELRDEVGRAHMKSMVDKDKRELRILQELYFEDGDLHGQGRQRKFRWNNMPTNQESSDVHQSDSEEGDEDDTQEAERRKERIEREKFLQDSKQAEENVQLSLDNTSVKIVTNVRKSDCAERKTSRKNTSFGLFGQAKRGSFLSRGQSVLKKLAVLTKENQTLGGAKQGGNFVFQQLSAEEAERMKEKKVPSKPIVRSDRSFSSLDHQTRSASIFKHL